MWKNYFNADTVEDALQRLNNHAGKAKVISGGTDLVLQLEQGLFADQDLLVDVSRISELGKIYQDKDGNIHVGATVTHSQVVGSAVVQKGAPLLVQACASVGSPQIRNRGTVVGNLVTGSPANDTISPLMALDATLVLRSLSGSRSIKLSEFYTGVRKTVLQPNELVTEVIFKALGSNQVSLFKKYALRKAQAISLVNASILITLANSKVESASITLGSVTPVIIHASKTEKALEGKLLNTETITLASSFIKEDIAPISDIRSSADYRIKIASLLVRRGLDELSQPGYRSPVEESPVLLWGKSTPNNSKTTSGSHAEINTTINGKVYQFKTGQEKTLLHLIREEAGLTGSKEGCGEGECGACTVFLDGVAVMSCLVPAPRADGAEIVTIEGVGEGQALHPVQKAFIDEGAVQCGYCTPGFVMSAVKLFEEKQNPDIDQIKMAITGNLCRCTGYYKIVKAIESVAGEGS